MSLVLDIADYIATKEGLVLDTNLFIGYEPTDSPDSCMIVSESPGGYEKECGMEIRAIQILTKDIAYVTTENRARAVHEHFKNVAGFSDTITGVRFCEVINSPFSIDRDERKRWIFSSNYLITKEET